MADPWSHMTDLEGVYHGREAMWAILSAFLRTRGRFDVNVSIGVETERPGEVLVLVIIGTTKAIFTPRELRLTGETIVESIPRARAFGASKDDVDELRGFAAILIRNAEDATAVSPHGLH